MIKDKKKTQVHTPLHRYNINLSVDLFEKLRTLAYHKKTTISKVAVSLIEKGMKGGAE